MDLSRFHATFFQESFEALSTMETGLLALARNVEGRPDPETFHEVFRAAHSMKGASATFGFEEISEYTHLLETILEDMRDKKTAPASSETASLLKSIDWLRKLLNARLENRELEPRAIVEAIDDLKTILASWGSRTPDPSAEKSSAAAAGQEQDLFIKFSPHKSLFHFGNDPLNFIRELNSCGQIKCLADISQIPKLSELKTDDCLLSWDISLSRTRSTIVEVRQIFDWIEGECDLTITDTTERETVRSETKTEAAEQQSRTAVTLRVAAEKVDSLINLVGELVITQSMLSGLSDDVLPAKRGKVRERLAQLSRNTRELQETVLKIRMLPIGDLFDRFPRLVFDLGHKLGKVAKLEISGEKTELDKTVLEKLADPLLHLIRNSMDHGLERAAVRREVGKPEEGIIHLSAEHRGGNVIVQVSDDGCGLNEQRILARARERGIIADDANLTRQEIHELIFEPGFSTADRVTDLSGRGVGMDVVRRNVEELGGRIDLESANGLGTTFTIRLPLTLAILEGQLIRTKGHRFVLPMVSIVESLKLDKSALCDVGDGVQLYRLRGEYLRVARLEDIFGLKSLVSDDESKSLLVVVESRQHRLALQVDALLAQQQVVLKSLEKHFRKVEGLAGATILGDGTVAMILDVAGIIEKSKRVGAHAGGKEVREHAHATH